MSGVEPRNLREFDTPEQSSRDMKALQSLADQARRVTHVIDLNIETIDAMTEATKRLGRIANGSAACDPQMLGAFLERLERAMRRHRYSLKNAAVLAERAKALSEQLRDTISLRNSEMNRLSTEETKRNTEATLELSERSGYEAHVVKMLTLLALVFAPASFVAVSSLVQLSMATAQI